MEPSKIRQAFTCPVDNDSNWSIVVETIPNEMGSRRKDIPRLNGSALECNMEMELEIPPAKGSRGGKVIIFLRMEKPRSTSGLDVGSSFGDQGIGNEGDPRLPGENDEEEEEYGHLEEREVMNI